MSGSDAAGTPDPEVPAGAGSAALVVSMLLVASSVLGLLRDLSLAGLFGASGDTDAFLVSWTIPETVTVLLMEGALSYLLVPVFVTELDRVGSIDRVVRRTLLPLVAALTLATTVLIVAAPLVVDVLAPGLEKHELAVRCVRVAASTVLFMGISGYFMAVLRANHRFAIPASTYVAYNVGIIATMYALHNSIGVLAAALGLAVGSALMVLVQVRGFRRHASLRGLSLRIDRPLLFAATAFVPVAGYSFGRQLQVYVERVVASTLPPGSISYMNYASKVAQMASLVALTAAAVAFPAIARVASDRAAFRAKIEQELRRLMALILPAVSFLVLFAEPCIRLLFQRGRFDAADTAATSGVMQVYSVGLIGQVLVSLGAIVCFSDRSRSWLPAVGAGTGLLVTTVLDVSLAPLLGVVALAIGNACGILVAAATIWTGVHRRVVDIRLSGARRLLLLQVVVAVLSATVAWLLCQWLPEAAVVQVVAGGVLTLGLHLLVISWLGVDEARLLLASAAAPVARVLPRGLGGRR